MRKKVTITIEVDYDHPQAKEWATKEMFVNNEIDELLSSIARLNSSKWKVNIDRHTGSFMSYKTSVKKYQ